MNQFKLISNLVPDVLAVESSKGLESDDTFYIEVEAVNRELKRDSITSLEAAQAQALDEGFQTESDREPSEASASTAAMQASSRSLDFICETNHSDDVAKQAKHLSKRRTVLQRVTGFVKFKLGGIGPSFQTEEPGKIRLSPAPHVRLGEGSFGKVIYRKGRRELKTPDGKRVVSTRSTREIAAKEQTVERESSDLMLVLREYHFGRRIAEEYPDVSDNPSAKMLALEIEQTSATHIKTTMLQTYLPGIPLDTVLEQHITKQQRFRVAYSILVALSKFHRIGINHNDLNKGNILVYPEELFNGAPIDEVVGSTHLIDLGRSIFTGTDSTGRPIRTATELAAFDSTYRPIKPSIYLQSTITKNTLDTNVRSSKYRPTTNWYPLGYCWPKFFRENR